MLWRGKGQTPSEAASLDVSPPAELVLLVLESKCLFIGMLSEMGLVELEMTFSLFGQGVTKTSVLVCAPAKGNGKPQDPRIYLWRVKEAK